MPKVKFSEHIELVTECDCGSHDHRLTFRLIEWDNWPFIEVSLGYPYAGFWRRLKYAIKYLVGKDKYLSCGSEVMITERNIEQFEEVIIELKEWKKKWEEFNANKKPDLDIRYFKEGKAEEIPQSSNEFKRSIHSGKFEYWQEEMEIVTNSMSSDDYKELIDSANKEIR